MIQDVCSLLVLYTYTHTHIHTHTHAHTHTHTHTNTYTQHTTHTHTHTTHTYTYQVVITANEFDAVAVNQSTGIPAVGLPTGTSSLPPEVSCVTLTFDL